MTNARMLQCRWTHVKQVCRSSSPSVDIQPASPEDFLPSKVDASTWPEESHPKVYVYLEQISMV